MIMACLCCSEVKKKKEKKIREDLRLRYEKLREVNCITSKQITFKIT